MNRAHKISAFVVIGFASALACVDVIGIHDVPDSATLNESGLGDAADAAPTCDPSAPFATFSALQGLPSDGVATIVLSPDQLTAYICRGSPIPNTPLKLSYAQRTSPNGAFGSETNLTTNGRICSVTSTVDNLTLVWVQADVADAASFAPTHLYMAKRSNTGQSFNFSAATPLSGLNSKSEFTPFLRADGNVLYFTQENASNAFTIRLAYHDAGFQIPIDAPGVPAGAFDAIIGFDELTSYFNVGNNLEVATRGWTGEGFGTATKVAILDAGNGVQYTPLLLTDDRCTLYYEGILQTNAADGGTSFNTTVVIAHKTP